jgi:predicted TPR repeat methyltransferase
MSDKHPQDAPSDPSKVENPTPIEPEGKTPEQWFRMAMELHQNGHLVEAEEIYRQLLQVYPDHPDLQHYLGVLCHQLGRSEEALALMQQALATAPEQPDFHANLAPVLIHLHQLAEAEQACRTALRLQPGNLSARNNLGIVLKRTDRLSEAEEAFRWILRHVPHHADALCNLTTVLERQENFDEAAAIARKAVELKSQEGEYYDNLARTLRKAGKPEQALAVIKEWLRFDPQNPIAQHNLHALQGDNTTARCTAAYIQQTFDDFAPEFDQVLQRLEYAGPEVLKRELRRHLPQADARLRILDAGCGTGLAAPVLRPYASRLIGVDLSAKMLAIAERHDSYHALLAADLGEYLASTTETFDLIVSVDTLLYFGDLTDVLNHAAQRLAPGGWLMFSTEELPEPGTGTASASPLGYQLQPTGRYSHHTAYLERAIVEAQLQLVSMDGCVLRKECSQPVASLFVTARKSPS